MQTIPGQLYDYPKYYDLAFGSDWQAEFDFLKQCFARYSRRPVKRLFEPACGTGRLLVKFAAAGYTVAGNDLNAKAVAYCNDRLTRRGHAATARQGDMTKFRVTPKVDACFNMINSFRHLQTEQAALSHLRCVAKALARGGLYVLGLYLTPTRGPRLKRESWAAQRGHLSVISRLRSTDLDLPNREERFQLRFEIRTPTRQFQLAEQVVFRTYTQPQFLELLAGVEWLEIAEAFDFAYDIDRPISVTAETEDVVFVLRKKRKIEQRANSLSMM